MATWVQADFSILAFGGTNYHWAPTELVYRGIRRAKNQIIGEAESGKIKISQFDTTERVMWDFTIYKMPQLDRTLGAFTVRGFDSLRTLITSTLNYREQIVAVKPPGTILAAAVNARYWSSEFPDPYTAVLNGVLYHGDGSDLVIFRKDI